MSPAEMGPDGVTRLAIYIDASFRTEGVGADTRVYRGYANFGFMIFACAVGAFFDRWAVIGRATPDPAETPNRLPAGIELLPLPYYSSLRDVGAVAKAIPLTARAMWRALDGIDAVWVSGAHPIGLLLICLALLRRRRVILLIRQDTPRYFRTRLPGPAWASLLLPLRVVDWIFRLLARRMPTTVVGPEIARAYGGLPPAEHPGDAHQPAVQGPARQRTGVRELARASQAADRRSDREREEPEAGDRGAGATRAGTSRPLLPDLGGDRAFGGGGPRTCFAPRDRRPPRTYPGFVPFGPKLLERYRSADAFLHVSGGRRDFRRFSMRRWGPACRSVATDVGGVREALDDGRAGPGRCRLETSRPSSTPYCGSTPIPTLRRRLAGRALRLSEEVAIESQSEQGRIVHRGSAGGFVLSVAYVVIAHTAPHQSGSFAGSRGRLRCEAPEMFAPGVEAPSPDPR